MDKARVLGIDVSQRTLDVCELEKESGTVVCRSRYHNTPAGHKRFCATYKNSTDILVVMEATGNYHRKFVQALSNQHIPLCIVNPLSIKRFAQMKLTRAKTDKADAYLIAEYGRMQKLTPLMQPSAVQQQLRALGTVIDQVTKQATQLKNSIHAQKLLPVAVNAPLVRSLNRLLKNSQRELKRLEAQRSALIRQHEQYALLYKRITSIKGLGEQTATACIAYFGDFSTFTSYKQIVSFIGTNPYIQQSGTSLKKSRISKQGHRSLRTLFYLASLSASRTNQACTIFYQRLVTKGKNKKTALIAVANKLIKQMFAIIKNGTMYREGYASAN